MELLPGDGSLAISKHLTPNPSPTTSEDTHPGREKWDFLSTILRMYIPFGGTLGGKGDLIDKSKDSSQHIWATNIHYYFSMSVHNPIT